MYIGRVEVQDVKCFSNIVVDLFVGGKPRLWTNILGQNGFGKSTLLQTIGVSLAGVKAMDTLVPQARDWLRRGSTQGFIRSQLLWTEGDATTNGKNTRKKKPYTTSFRLSKDAGLNQLTLFPVDDVTEGFEEWWDKDTRLKPQQLRKDGLFLSNTAYATHKTGWFSCGYGPYRRLTGGNASFEDRYFNEERVGRFSTLFREDISLTKATDYLQGMYLLKKSGYQRGKRILDLINRLLVEGLFPEPVELKVDANHVLVSVNQRRPVYPQHLSDGYRSMLALIIDMVRWMDIAFPDSNDLTLIKGVVLIDELDAHAHPVWQREIGFWLRRTFPNLQFIVATHSPFLAQVADEPGGNIVLEQTPNGVVIKDDIETVENWRIDQILTELFGLPSTRSPEVERKRLRFQQLSLRKDLLSNDEAQEYQSLKEWIQGLPPAIEDPAERKKAEIIQQAVEHISKARRASK